MNNLSHFDTIIKLGIRINPSGTLNHDQTKTPNVASVTIGEISYTLRRHIFKCTL